MSESKTEEFRCGFWNMLADGLAYGEFMCKDGDAETTPWNIRGSKVCEVIETLMTDVKNIDGKITEGGCDFVCTVENDKCIHILEHLRKTIPHADIKCVYLLKFKPDFNEEIESIDKIKKIPKITNTFNISELPKDNDNMSSARKLKKWKQFLIDFFYYYCICIESENNPKIENESKIDFIKRKLQEINDNNKDNLYEEKYYSAVIYKIISNLTSGYNCKKSKNAPPYFTLKPHIMEKDTKKHIKTAFTTEIDNTLAIIKDLSISYLTTYNIYNIYNKEYDNIMSSYAGIYDRTIHDIYDSEDGIAIYYKSSKWNINTDLQYKGITKINFEGNNLIDIYIPNSEPDVFLPISFTSKSKSTINIIGAHMSSGESIKDEIKRLKEINKFKEIIKVFKTKNILLMDSNVSRLYLESYIKGIENVDDVIDTILGLIYKNDEELLGKKEIMKKNNEIEKKPIFEVVKNYVEGSTFFVDEIPLLKGLKVTDDILECFTNYKFIKETSKNKINSLYDYFNEIKYISAISADQENNTLFKCFKMRHAKGTQPGKFGDLIYDTIDKCYVSNDLAPTTNISVYDVLAKKGYIYNNLHNFNDILSLIRNNQQLRESLKQYMMNNKKIKGIPNKDDVIRKWWAGDGSDIKDNKLYTLKKNPKGDVYLINNNRWGSIMDSNDNDTTLLNTHFADDTNISIEIKERIQKYDADYYKNLFNELYPNVNAPSDHPPFVFVIKPAPDPATTLGGGHNFKQYYYNAKQMYKTLQDRS